MKSAAINSWLINDSPLKNDKIYKCNGTQGLPVIFGNKQSWYQGSVAEWSKALVLGTSHFGGVGSNPITIKNFYSLLRSNGGCTF